VVVQGLPAEHRAAEDVARTDVEGEYASFNMEGGDGGGGHGAEDKSQGLVLDHVEFVLAPGRGEGVDASRVIQLGTDSGEVDCA
jgi:hypothetical protein